MTQTTVPAASAASPAASGRTGRRPAWPLLASAAGVAGLVATMILDGRETQEPGETVELSAGLFESLDPFTYKMSMVVGYVAVVLLLVLAAQWRRRVEPRFVGSTAVHLVPLGLLASAAGLTYGYGWKGALGLYMPGGFEDTGYDEAGLAVYYMLCDFGAWIGCLGVVVAAGAVAWMGLKERLVSRWLGAFAVLPVLQTTLMVAGLGVPGVPALLAPLWLFVTGLGLYFGRSAVAR